MPISKPAMSAHSTAHTYVCVRVCMCACFEYLRWSEQLRMQANRKMYLSFNGNEGAPPIQQPVDEVSMFACMKACAFVSQHFCPFLASLFWTNWMHFYTHSVHTHTHTHTRTEPHSVSKQIWSHFAWLIFGLYQLEALFLNTKYP